MDQRECYFIVKKNQKNNKKKKFSVNLQELHAIWCTICKTCFPILFVLRFVKSHVIGYISVISLKLVITWSVVSYKNTNGDLSISTYMINGIMTNEWIW